MLVRPAIRTVAIVVLVRFLSINGVLLCFVFSFLSFVRLDDGELREIALGAEK